MRFSLIFIALLSSISTHTLANEQADEKSYLTIIPNHNPQLIRNFNPFINSRLHTARDFIYEPLVIFNELKGNIPVFRLAKNYTVSDDLLSLTFDLRNDVKWSDGEQFTADDILYTFNMIKENSALDDRGIAKRITKIEKNNDYVITFTFNEVNTSLVNDVVSIPIVPQHIWSKIEKPETFTNKNPVGTGPFTEIERFTSTLFTQCRNPNYWDNSNLKVDCLRIPQKNHNDQVLADLINSEIDWAGSFVPDIDRVFVDASKNHGYWYPPAGTQSFVLNFNSNDPAKKEALENVDFRRAFSMSLNRQEIIDIAIYGNGKVNDFASGLGYGFESWSDKKTHEKYKPYMTYNVKEAKALLKKAGFIDKDGDGFVETPSGKKLTLEIQSPNGWTDFNNIVLLASEQINAIGIKTQARTPDFSVYNQAMITADYDIAYTNYFHGASPHKYWESAYHSRYQKKDGMPRFAMHFWKNAELDTLLDSFYQTDKHDQQMTIAHKIQALLAENMVTIPILSGPNFYQYNTKRFTGWWNEANPKGRPMIWEGTPERVLHVLDLKPVAATKA